MTYNRGMRPIPSRRPPLLAALALYALVSGCATEAGLKRLDSTLNEIDLRQGKVAVLGVVKFEEPDQVRPPLIAMLEKALREERRDIPLVPADSVRGRVGEERARRILLDYEYQGALEAGSLGELSDSLRGTARFLLLARVEKDRTRTSARGIAGANTDVSGAGYAMGVTGRDARVAIHLYDLLRRTLAASATYEGSSENTKAILAPVAPGGGSRTEVTVGPAQSPEEQGYPGAPELAQALEEPFRTFARELPGAPAGSAAQPTSPR
jgi:hypothetical protein